MKAEDKLKAIKAFLETDENQTEIKNVKVLNQKSGLVEVKEIKKVIITNDGRQLLK